MVKKKGEITLCAIAALAALVALVAVVGGNRIQKNSVIVYSQGEGVADSEAKETHGVPNDVLKSLPKNTNRSHKSTLP